MMGRGDYKKIEVAINGALEAVMDHVRALEKRVEELEAQNGEATKGKTKVASKAA